jgi:hypothetical protein
MASDMPEFRHGRNATGLQRVRNVKLAEPLSSCIPSPYLLFIEPFTSDVVARETEESLMENTPIAQD